MNKKVKFVWFTDLHINKWKSHNQGNRRLHLGREALSIIRDECLAHSCPAIFTGDLYHQESDVHQEVIDLALVTYKEFFEDNKILFLAISGNHDQSEMNASFDNPSPSHLNVYNKLFSTFSLLDYSYIEYKDTIVCGIPYNRGNVDLRTFIKKFRKVASTGRRKILLLHTDLPGAKDTTGIELHSYENISRDYAKFFSGFDLVLSGHIHKAQRLAKKVYMGGAMYQQRVSDMGCEMGYWLIYEDLTLKFIPLAFPTFKITDKDDGFNYCIPKVKDPLDEIHYEGTKSNYEATNTPLDITQKYLEDQNITHKLRIKALNQTISKI